MFSEIKPCSTYSRTVSLNPSASWSAPTATFRGWPGEADGAGQSNILESWRLVFTNTDWDLSSAALIVKREESYCKKVTPPSVTLWGFWAREVPMNLVFTNPWSCAVTDSERVRSAKRQLPEQPLMSGRKTPCSWHLRNDKRESRGGEAAVSCLLPDALFSAAVPVLGGHHISRDGWFPGAIRTGRKNRATTMRDPCWASQSNSDAVQGHFLFYCLQVEPHTWWDRRACGPSPAPSAHKGSSEAARRVDSVGKTGTGTFAVTANPCNHGNFCTGSLETVGRPQSKYSGGELTNLSVTPHRSQAPQRWPGYLLHSLSLGGEPGTPSLETGSVTKHYLPWSSPVGWSLQVDTGRRCRHWLLR